MKVKVLVRGEVEGGFSVSVPAMPGCHSQGETIDEAIDNIREATDLWMDVQNERATREILQTNSPLLLQEIEL